MVLNIGQKLRFAPSPNGYLHLGHAYSALLNWQIADRLNAQCLLRIEDIDIQRSKPEFCAAIFEDLTWLGLSWPEPVLCQSSRFEAYQTVLDDLIAQGLVYPAFLSRREIKEIVGSYEARGARWPRDPDGSPLYPGKCKMLSPEDRRMRIDHGDAFSWRLDMEKAIAIVGESLFWSEYDANLNHVQVVADASLWGDVVLARRDIPTSYHLSVVLDDAFQEIDFIVRGMDLYQATSVHRLLQVLLGLPEPCYHHHRLIQSDDDKKLSKSDRAKSLRELRDGDGLTLPDIKALIGFV